MKSMLSMFSSSQFGANSVDNMSNISVQQPTIDVNNEELFVAKEDTPNLLETVENSPRVLFLMSIICGGILLMICIFCVGLTYFGCRKLQWELSRDNQAEKIAKMASITKEQFPQFVKFQPVLRELKSFAFDKKRESDPIQVNVVADDRNAKKCASESESYPYDDDEEKALIHNFDTTGFIGENSLTKESIVCGANSFEMELDGGCVVDEMLLDGIVNSMETRRKTMLR